MCRWPPITQRARSRRSYGKVGDCEKSSGKTSLCYDLLNFWPKKQITNSYGNLFSRRDRRGIELVVMLIFKCAFSVFVDVSTNSVQLSSVKQFPLQTVIIGHHNRPFIAVVVELTMGKVELPLFQALVSAQCKS